MKSKRVLCYLAVLALVATLAVGTVMADDANSWQEAADISWYNADSNSFTLTTPQQLAGLAVIVNSGDARGIADSFKDKTITLGKDIDLKGKTWTPIGHSISPFNGILDGHGFTVSGLGEIVVSEKETGTKGYLGLFGYTDKKAVIRNLNVQGDIVTSGDKRYALGGIVGYNHSTGTEHSLVENCTFTGSITGCHGAKISSIGYGYNGGIVGENLGAVRNCLVSADITAKSDDYPSGTLATNSRTHFGGIIGCNHVKYDSSSGTYDLMAVVEGCHSKGSIRYCNDTITKESVCAGGIAGSHETKNSVIKNCVSEMDVDIAGMSQNASLVTLSNFTNNAGGIVGKNKEACIYNCFSTGTVSAGQSGSLSAAICAAGGIVGGDWKASWTAKDVIVTIKDCAAACTVKGTNDKGTPYKGEICGFSYTTNPGYNNQIVNCRFVEDNVNNIPAVSSNKKINVVSTDAVSSDSDLPPVSVIVSPMCRVVEQKSGNIAAQVYPVNAKSADAVSVSWSSSNESVASIVPSGKSVTVNGISSGLSGIIATCSGLLGGAVNSPYSTAIVYLKGMEHMKLDPADLTLNSVGEEKTIKAEILPSTDTLSYPVLKWTYEVEAGEGARADDLELICVKDTFNAKVVLRKKVVGAKYRIRAAAIDGSGLSADVVLSVVNGEEKPDEPEEQKSSSGGCNTGLGWLLLLAPVPALVLKRRGKSC